MKLALESLLGGPCYHMTEQINRPAEAAVWASGFGGGAVDWQALLDGWVATVDWPGCTFALELAEVFPDAKVLLSVRDGESWWASATRTIFLSVHNLDDDNPFKAYVLGLFARSGIDMDDRDASIAAFDAHNERIRGSFGPDRLIEWHLGDGWAPICAGLGLPEPEQAFPHANSGDGYLDMVTAAAAGRPPRVVEPPPYDAD